jgi:RHS repeat-associated protein
MGWDCLNRMTSLINSSGTTNYSYRADGMRVYKSGAFGSSTSFYDGQMPFETTDVATSGTTVTDNAVGPRGIDAMIVTTSSGTATSFPLYDAHGNMVATLARSGSTFTTGNQRSFDAWGGIRGGPQSGAPKGRYCAQLGHVQDDESGLIYMRARYYEPGTGRFVSEDRSENGCNWYSYANEDPINNVDSSGKNPAAVLLILANLVGFCVAFAVTYALITDYYEFMFPGYKGGQILAGALVAVGGTILSALYPLSKEAAASAEDLGAFVRTAMRSLAQTGAGGMMEAGGFGALIGVIMGIVTAVVEFVCSDYYEDN